MQITQVTVHYEELRSAEYTRSNRKVGVSMTATIEEGDDPVKVRETLLARCKHAVKLEHGDTDARQQEYEQMGFKTVPNIELD
jgi:hypothetical protein